MPSRLHGLLAMLQRLISATAWLGIALLAASPVQAGSITRSSIWNQAAAMRDARSRVPQGAQITGSRCKRISVANDFRWQCTVNYSTTPQPSVEAPEAGAG
tara:strand:- start:331 stop:633 length:303 start_codon:yes stop_codon:yes gene_type:complete